MGDPRLKLAAAFTKSTGGVRRNLELPPTRRPTDESIFKGDYRISFRERLSSQLSSSGRRL
jgi:hypothetical protein